MGIKFTTTDFIDRAIQVHGSRYDYSQTKYVRSRDKVVIVCRKHGPFAQRASAHLDGCGCPKCQREWSDEHKANHVESARKSRGMMTEEWVRRAKLVHGDKYDYSQTVYVNQRTDVTIICPKHGAFTQKADSHIRGCGCKKCGDESENHIGAHNWSDAQKAKIAATCLERYGALRYLDSAEGKLKNAEVRSDPAFKAKMKSIISSDRVQAKTRATSLARYGVESPAMLKETQAKIYVTKKRNHTVTSSKAEQIAYAMLVEKFGNNDVEHHHKDNEKYPFVCDFYISSLDVYIELNLHWSHGRKWFLGTDADMAKLETWKAKAAAGSDYYACAIQTWTERDVLKRETAIRNTLNYLVFWSNDLSDFMAWLNSDNLVVNNISN